MATLSRIKKSILWLKIKTKKTNWKKVVKPEPGKLYLSLYDAKHKDTLPIWDSAPLTMFWAADSQHIYGLNFHYLPPEVRKRLFSVLKKKAGDRKYPQISSAFISSIAKQKVFAPAVHKYLFSHFKSNLLEIPIAEWELVIDLPLAKWHKNK